MRYYVSKDPRGCGERVAAAALMRGHEQVSEIHEAQVGYVRTVNYGPGLGKCLDELNMLKVHGVPSIPDWRYADLYDNKRNQVRVLRPWLPETHVITDPEEAPRLELPFVSKASHGSASKCVRLVKTKEEVTAELWDAFHDGIKTPGGRVQKGYLIWQRLVPDNAGDIRVCVCGHLAYGLFRQNRDDVPFASGSGRIEPVKNMASVRAREAFALASHVAKTLGMDWACFDVVFDGYRPLILEVSFSWTEASYAGCQCFDRITQEPVNRTGAQWAEIAVDEMERIAR